MRPIPLAVLCVGVLVGCARESVLRPAPGARVVTERPKTAYAETRGVRVWVDGDAWSGYPSNLEELVTPVWVHVENDSPYPIQVRYESFTLAQEGFRSQPLPPFTLSRTSSNAPVEPPESTDPRLASAGPTVPAQVRANIGVRVRPRFRHRAFHVSPYHRHVFHPQVGFSVWNDPFPPYSPYYRDYYRDWEPDLPTRDMLQRAVPEGVIDSGGGVSGFLYFQRVQADGPVTFQMDLVRPKTGDQIGTIQIPLVVVRD